jgi:tripartite-type tricarboxylate transporter receptor subunit TctC
VAGTTAGHDEKGMMSTSMRSFRRLLAAVSVAALTAVATLPARAADVASFYKGRTVQVLIGFSPGGGYDIYARTLARYMGKHIPGNPTLVPQNMPGAGTLKVANYIYNVAPKDGTVFGTFARGIPMEKLLGRTVGEQFDATKFTWIGSITDEPSVCVFWAASGIRSFQDMKTKPWKVGGSGVTSDLDIYANVLRNMFHLPGRLITGFPGGTEVLLSMRRGEVDGRCGWSWSALLSRDRDLLDKKLVTVPLQLGVEVNKDIPDVPLILDQTNDPKEKAALKLIFSRQVMARPFAAPPGLSPERAKALRDAFDATMKDEGFLAEMRKLDLEVRPQSGAKVEQLVKEVYSYPADVVKIASDAIKTAR